MSVTVVDHPLVATRLSLLRAQTTTTAEFRRSLQQLSVFLLAEASRTWPLTSGEVQTPLQTCAGFVLARPIVLVPILRAGLGMLDGMLPFLPDAQVGHIGLYRNEETLRPVTYYSRLPANLADAQVLLLDPMLATGHSACAAASLLRERGAREVQFICIVACPAGIEQFEKTHPEIPIITAAIDSHLNDVGYIVPGLGDAGDRYFGTDPGF